MKPVKKLYHRTANRLSARPKLFRHKNGWRLYVSGRMAWAFVDGQYYERNVEYWLTNFAKRLVDPVFYDIGANIGYYTMVIGNLSHKAYAFEPSPRTRRLLSLHLKLNGFSDKVDIIPYGLANEEGEAKINIYNSSGNNSLFERRIPQDHPLHLQHKATIQLTTLDALYARNSFLPPSLIKLDIEGGELNALRGAANLLQEHHPILLFEYSNSTSRDAGYARSELTKLLAPFGYQFFALAEDPDDLLAYAIDQDGLPPIDNVIAIPQSGLPFTESGRTKTGLRTLTFNP